MDDHTAKMLVSATAEIMAAQARIEGMKALNVVRTSNGHALAYDDDAFFNEAQGLAVLADHVRQL